MLLVAAVVCIGFSACSDSDDDGPTQGVKDAIVGHWQLYKTETITKFNGQVVGREIEIASEQGEGFGYLFNADKTFEAWEQPSAGRWNLETTGKWSLSSGKLKLSFTDEGVAAKSEIIVNSITNTEMELQYADEWKGGHYVDGKWQDETTTTIETYVKGKFI